MKENSYEETSTNRARSRKKPRSTVESVQSDILPEVQPVADFLSFTKAILSEKFANIIEAIAQRSAEGSLPHTKYLFEIGGVKEELLRQIENNGEPSLADLLLDAVKRGREAVPTAAAADAKTPDESVSTPCADPISPVNNSGAKGQ